MQIPLRQRGIPEGASLAKTIDVGNPLVDALCPACEIPLEPGDKVALVPLGPGPDADDRERARNNRWHSGRSAAVHWSCATGDEPEQDLDDIGPWIREVYEPAVEIIGEFLAEAAVRSVRPGGTIPMPGDLSHNARAILSRLSYAGLLLHKAEEEGA